MIEGTSEFQLDDSETLMIEGTSPRDQVSLQLPYASPFDDSGFICDDLSPSDSLPKGNVVDGTVESQASAHGCYLDTKEKAPIN